MLIKVIDLSWNYAKWIFFAFSL